MILLCSVLEIITTLEIRSFCHQNNTYWLIALYKSSILMKIITFHVLKHEKKDVIAFLFIIFVVHLKYII